jgi:hypothetical protein
MLSKIEQYILKIEELRQLGEEILCDEDLDINDELYSEVDCMDGHLEISLDILKSNLPTAGDN